MAERWAWLSLEFSTWTELDTDEWIDPEVMAHDGLEPADVVRDRNPKAHASQGGRVPQPEPTPRYRFTFPEEWRERGEALYPMSDEELCAVFSDTEPPVPKRRKAG